MKEKSERRKTRRIVPALLGWFAAHARDLPWRRTRDAYAIWVSEVMLQQTQVKTVLPYWERWMKAMPDVRALGRARSRTLHKLWEGLGYYTRVRNMQKAARLIVAQHGGKFPQKFEEVLALPGIGRYTAGAICSIAFNHPTPIVDGNVARVLARVFGVEGEVRDKDVRERLWELAGELVGEAQNFKLRASNFNETSNSKLQKETTAPLTTDTAQSRGSFHVSLFTYHAFGCSHLNQSLMELGALVCTPKGPRCEVCPVATNCVAFREGRVEELPVMGARQRTTQRRFVAVALQRKGSFFVQQRPGGIVNGHLWEFPNVEVGLRSNGRREAKRMLGENGAVSEPFCTIKHSITRYRITMEVFRARGELTNEWGPPSLKLWRTSQTNGDGKWLRPEQLRRLPFASAHRKVLEKLLGETGKLKTGK
ncbi:MAG: hypothetical protein C5B50_28945 [Verrucomicrobia bacterium]|nr:MAG: hypothetical protein C5B50_28945 [Verrucomicrobiota bacterium]